ncbi:hypothetical protein ACLOJK_034639 [Asimina triloba]
MAAICGDGVDGLDIFVNGTFKYKENFFSLYIFRNRKAFELCDFSQAILLNNGSSQAYEWHPSRMGFFYFTFNNGSVGASCKQGEKASISVLEKDMIEGNSSLPPSLAPSPVPGGGFPSTPAYHLPFHNATAIAPRASSPASNPSVLPDTGGGIPFINSNPAVPLPTGETDSATIRPLPTSGSRDHAYGIIWSVYSSGGQHMSFEYAA